MNPACKFTLIRYADDFVVLTDKRTSTLCIYETSSLLKGQGLELSPEKTKVTHIEEGFEFLGFLIRQYQTEQGINCSSNQVRAVDRKRRRKLEILYVS